MKTRVGGGTPGGGSGAVALMEALESRQLMSTSVSWVGVDYGPNGPSVYLADAQLGDDLTLTGTQTIARLDGISTSQALDVLSVAFNGGTSTWTRAGGFAPFVSQAGTEFRTTGKDYSLGVLRGIYDDGNGDSGETTRYVIERRGVFDAIRNGGNYIVLRTIEITADGVKYDQDFLRVRFANGQPSQIWVSDTGLENSAVVYEITEWTNDGVIRFGTNQSIMLGRRMQGATTEEFGLYFDGDNSDGNLKIGVAFSEVGTANIAQLVPTAAALQMLYRGTILAQGEVGRGFIGLTDPAARGLDVVVELNVDASYAMYRASEYGTSGATAISSGTWVSGQPHSMSAPPSEAIPDPLVNAVKLTDGEGRALIFATSSAFGLAAEAVIAGTQVERLAGFLATIGRAVTTQNLVMAPQYVQVDESGSLFLVGAGGVSAEDVIFRRLDLSAAAGGKTFVSAVLMRNDLYRFNDWYIPALSTDGDVYLFRISNFSLGGTNLTVADMSTSETSALHNIRFSSGASLAVADYRDPTSQTFVLAGRTTSGDLMYVTGRPGNPNAGAIESHTEFLQVRNLTAALQGVGETPPTANGPFYVYETYWGAKNLLFLNDAGQVQVVWTAPAIDRWYLNNLSEIAGATPLVGQLSTIVTSWRGIHIHGLDASGNLHSIWWAPALLGEWVDTNLTQEQSGVALALIDSTQHASTLATWVGSEGDLHIMAIDQSGDLRLYWWDFSTLDWLVVHASSNVDPAARVTRVLGQAAASAPSWNLIFGQTATGDLVRTYATGIESGDWISENLARRFV